VAGRTPTDAVKAFGAPIQRALTCFVPGRVSVDSYDEDVEGVLTFNRADDVRLPGESHIHLSVLMRYRIIQLESPPDSRKPWKVTTTHWAYELKDRDLSWIVQYHWHPSLTPDIAFPHMHHAKDTVRCHLPTGRVLLEDVLRFAVELGAEPVDHDKWADVSRKNVENFAKSATWGLPPG
jgi:hypothetical protein